MTRTLWYALFLVFATLAVFGASQVDEAAPEASAVGGGEGADVAEGDADADADGGDEEPEPAADQPAPNRVSRVMASQRLSSGGIRPGKKRSKWLVPVAILGTVALLAAGGIGGFFLWRKFQKGSDEAKDVPGSDEATGVAASDEAKGAAGADQPKGSDGKGKGPFGVKLPGDKNAAKAEGKNLKADGQKAAAKGDEGQKAPLKVEGAQTAAAAPQQVQSVPT